ncbi:hypothetical protein AAFF_G00375490 [Aldrovandia affinis]|uniref:Uncharacterized protein n=1 Tax=Aldrovandia affinis TaxID=143900 RepID=A0AAD7WM98_9TELE|nr:hypothetical protein AAFF_G00375490 [Aldrovandia affinis]
MASRGRRTLERLSAFLLRSPRAAANRLLHRWSGGEVATVPDALCHIGQGHSVHTRRTNSQHKLATGWRRWSVLFPGACRWLYREHPSITNAQRLAFSRETDTALGTDRTPEQQGSVPRPYGARSKRPYIEPGGGGPFNPHPPTKAAEYTGGRGQGRAGITLQRRFRALLCDGASLRENGAPLDPRAVLHLLV